MPVTVFRCVHIFGPPEHPGPTATPFIAGPRGRVTVPGDGRQLIAPLMLEDVVAAVVAATTRPQPLDGTFEIAGPETMSLDRMVRTLNRGEVTLRHVPAPILRLPARVSPTLTPEDGPLAWRPRGGVTSSMPVIAGGAVPSEVRLDPGAVPQR